MFNNVQDGEIVLRFRNVSADDITAIVDEFGDVSFEAVAFTLPEGTTVLETNGNAHQAEETEASSRDDPTGGSVSVRPGADPFYVLEVLASDESWVPSTEIRDRLPEGNGINFDTISNTLWRLDERNLVDSRQYEQDKRVREYRISSIGRDAFQTAAATSNDESNNESPQVSVQIGGDPFYILDTLEGDDTWKTSSTILSEGPDDLNEDALSSTLWRLGNRGLIESRPYAKDKRYKEYKLTTTGQHALEAAKHREAQLHAAA